MYTPPILYATQDDINARRKVRQQFAEKQQAALLNSITEVENRDKFERSLKEGNKAKEKKKKKKKDGKNKIPGSASKSALTAAPVQPTSDVVEKSATYQSLQNTVDLAATSGPVAVVRLMRANPTHFKILTLCIATLGDMASFSRRDRLGFEKGMFLSRQASEYHTPSTHICIAIGHADGIKAILDCTVKHRAKDGLVLRGLWALEHILAVDENWLKFTRQGGPTRLEVIAEVDYTGKGPNAKKIAASLKILKRQPVAGDNIRSKLCVLL